MRTQDRGVVAGGWRRQADLFSTGALARHSAAGAGGRGGLQILAYLVMRRSVFAGVAVGSSAVARRILSRAN
jgi:hypothetical protein